MPKSILRILVGVCFIACLVWGPTSAARAQTPEQPEAAQPNETVTPPPPTPDKRYESPRATLGTFFDAMKDVQNPGLSIDRQKASLEEAAKCFALGGLEEEAGKTLAQDLQEVFNRIGDVAGILSRMPNVKGSEGTSSFTLYPTNNYWIRGMDGYAAVETAAPDSTIILERDEIGEWRFNLETAEGLTAFKSAVASLKAESGVAEIALTIDRKIAQYVPDVLKSGVVLRLEYWKWIGLFVLIFVGMLLDYSIRFFIRRVWRRIMKRRGKVPDKKLLQKAVRPFGLFASAMLFYWSVRLLGLPPTALTIVLAAVRIFLMLSTVWAAFRVTDLIGEFLLSRAAGTITKFDDLLVPLVRKTLKVFISAVGLIYIADAFKIEIMPLLTGLGIGGLAFAFAAKDTIENFFGSIAVIADRPFEVGDWVAIGDVEGTVEEMGFRSTRVRTFYNSLVSVPNATLVRATVDNYGRRRFRRWSTHVGVTYDTTPDDIETFCEGIREIIRLHPYTRKDYFHVWLNKFGPSSLDIMLYVFHECPDWGTELRERQRLILDIMRLAHQLNIEFAFPTQTLHIARDEARGVEDAGAGEAGGPVGERSAEPVDQSVSDARRDGIAAVREMTRGASWLTSKPPVVTYAGKPPSAHGPLQAEEE